LWRCAEDWAAAEPAGTAFFSSIDESGCTGVILCSIADTFIEVDAEACRVAGEAQGIINAIIDIRSIMRRIPANFMVVRLL
jgi:hypothetical protein